MPNTQIASVVTDGVVTILKVALPMLSIGLAAGLIISILQATTQINEQTMTFVPKLFLLGLMLFITGGWMMQMLMDLLRRAFELMVML